MSGKAPAFQFYVRDWLSDPELQMTSSSTRGIWVNALCYMWESRERGKLEGTVEELAKLLNSTNGDFDQFLKDIESHKFGDVRICNKNVTLINRRMYREQKERDNTRLRVSRLRSNIKCNADVTPPSSSSSSSSKKESIKKERNLPDSEWLKTLQTKDCYAHLKVDSELQKCVTWFEAKGITVSRQRFLNWINNPKFQSKPLQIQQPIKKEIPNPEIIPKDFIRDPEGQKKIQEIISSISKGKGA